MNGAAPNDLVYFLHIPKTSGTSLYDFLVRVLGKENALPPMLWDPLVTGTLKVTDKTRLVSGHLTGLLPLWLKRWPRIITMLREPLARALSHINHVQREGGHPLHSHAAGLSVTQYCDHPLLRKTVDNMQARHLASLSFSLALLPKTPPPPTGSAVAMNVEDALFALDRTTCLRDEAIRALHAIDAVGICEAHDPSLQLVARMLNWKGAVAESRLNKARDDQRTLATLTDREIDALTELNEVDNGVYRYGCQLFAKTCAENGIALVKALPLAA